MSTETATIFFSYARSDGAFVLDVAKALRKDGMSVWIDQLDIPSGSRWDESVEGALRTCSCVVVVMSPASMNSQNVLDEVAYALGERKTVVPLLLAKCLVPFRLQRIQHIDFTIGHEAGYQQLLATARRLRLPTPAPQPPAVPQSAPEPVPAPAAASAPSPTPAPAPTSAPPAGQDNAIDRESQAPTAERQQRRVVLPRTRPLPVSRLPKAGTSDRRVQREAAASAQLAVPDGTGAPGVAPAAPGSGKAAPDQEWRAAPGEPVRPAAAPPARVPSVDLSPTRIGRGKDPDNGGVRTVRPADTGNQEVTQREPPPAPRQQDAPARGTTASEREPVVGRGEPRPGPDAGAVPGVPPRPVAPPPEPVKPVQRPTASAPEAAAPPGPAPAPAQESLAPRPARDAVSDGRVANGQARTAPPDRTPLRPAPVRVPASPRPAPDGLPAGRVEPVFSFDTESSNKLPDAAGSAAPSPGQASEEQSPPRHRGRYFALGIVCLISAVLLASVLVPLPPDLQGRLPSWWPTATVATSGPSDRAVVAGTARGEQPPPSLGSPPALDKPAIPPQSPPVAGQDQAGNAGGTGVSPPVTEPGTQVPTTAKPGRAEQGQAAARSGSGTARNDSKNEASRQKGDKRGATPGQDTQVAGEVPERAADGAAAGAAGSTERAQSGSDAENGAEQAAPNAQQEGPRPSDQELRGLVRRYISNQDSGDIEGLLALYDERVDFHEYRLATRDYIRNYRQQFFQQWPRVETVLVDPIEINRVDANTADVSFTTFIHVREPALGNPGKVRNAWKVRVVNGSTRIISEHQSVLATPS